MDRRSRAALSPGITAMRSRASKVAACEIAPDVFEIRIRRVRTHLIAEDSLTLIDAGLPGSSEAIDRAIVSLGRSPSELRRIICTHAHFDHAGGAAELAARGGVEAFMHEADLATLSTTFRDVARYPGRRLFVALTPQLEKAVALHDGDELPVLSGLRVLHVPGHTPGSICLYAPRHRLLFVGDALQARLGRVGFASRLYSDNWQAARRSVKRMAELDVETIVFSHFPPRHDARPVLQRLANEAQVADTGPEPTEQSPR